jgi:hypothetical protein
MFTHKTYHFPEFEPTVNLQDAVWITVTSWATYQCMCTDLVHISAYRCTQEIMYHRVVELLPVICTIWT